jgi:hypothetical protein
MPTFGFAEVGMPAKVIAKVMTRASRASNKEAVGFRHGSTVRATELRETHRTERTRKRLTKPHMPQATTVRRYRTQEIAGSSPASSTPKPAPRTFLAKQSVVSGDKSRHRPSWRAITRVMNALGKRAAHEASVPERS